MPAEFGQSIASLIECSIWHVEICLHKLYIFAYQTVFSPYIYDWTTFFTSSIGLIIDYELWKYQCIYAKEQESYYFTSMHNKLMHHELCSAFASYIITIFRTYMFVLCYKNGCKNIKHLIYVWVRIWIVFLLVALRTFCSPHLTLSILKHPILGMTNHFHCWIQVTCTSIHRRCDPNIAVWYMLAHAQVS